MTMTKPGADTHSIAQVLKEEEIKLGMNFEYCLVAAGKSYNRTPSKNFLGIRVKFYRSTQAQI